MVHKYECTAEVLPNGHFSVFDETAKLFSSGQKLRLIIEPLIEVHQSKSDESAYQQESYIQNNKTKTDQKMQIFELAASEDWADWADPEEDIYEDFRISSV